MLAVEGIQELEEAAELQEAAQAIGAAGVEEIAEGAAELGAAVEEAGSCRTVEAARQVVICLIA